MRRYGWSSGREALSPYNSSLGDGGVPNVTDEDYEYITSEDLQNQGVDSQHAYDYDPRSSRQHFSEPSPILEIPQDDVLLIRHGKDIVREYFPAYSIGDGKVFVGDIRERVQLILKLSDKQTQRVKLLYKGRLLKDDNELACRYGVKNNSEIMVVLPEGSFAGDSDSGEEVIVVENGDDRDGGKKGRKVTKVKKNSNRSPRDSGSNVGLDVPRTSEDRRATSTSRAGSPASGVSATSAASAVPGSPMDKLNRISSHFTTTLLPMCVQFTASPPSDKKKREDEHRKISETVMQQVLLKLDEVDTGGDDATRSRRKELVRQVQDVLKGLDAKLHH